MRFLKLSDSLRSQASRRSMDRIVPSEGIDVGSIPAGRNSEAIPIGRNRNERGRENNCFPVQEGLGKPWVSQGFDSGREESSLGLKKRTERFPAFYAVDGIAEYFGHRHDFNF